jgi:putative transposase
MSDHVHLLIGLKAMHCLADVMRDIKANSSAWVKSEFNQRDFAWQDGYGAFTVSHSNIKTVREYIINQEEHHRECTFQKEYLLFLKYHETEYDERYLW